VRIKRSNIHRVSSVSASIAGPPHAPFGRSTVVVAFWAQFIRVALKEPRNHSASGQPAESRTPKLLNFLSGGTTLS